jgi:hypothetical protein
MEIKTLVIAVVVTALLIITPIVSYNYGYDKAEKIYNNNRFEGKPMSTVALFPIAICKGGSQFYVTNVLDVKRQLQNPQVETCFGGRTFLYSEELVPYILADNQSTWGTP